MEATVFGNYAPLLSTALLPETGFAQPSQVLPERVSLEDSALSVMTDLERVSAVLIRPGDSIDEANRRMIQTSGVARTFFEIETQLAR
jgi:hypothetical protein